MGNIVTTIGTEANIMAMRAARNHARNIKGIKEGEIIIPVLIISHLKKLQI